MGRAVMGVVMTLLAGSFAVWGINDIFSGFGRSTLAKIGSVEIPIEQFRQTYNDRLQQINKELGHPLPPDQASAIGLDRQVLGQMLGQSGLDQRAQQMGLAIPDAEIARHITTDPNLQTVNGKFDRERFLDVLRNLGTTERRFVADQRQNVLRRQIVDSVTGNLAPPQAWLEAIDQFQNQRRSIEYLAIGPAQAGDIAAPTPEQLAKYYDEHKFLFLAPEYRKIDAIAVTPAELAKWMEISDDDLKKVYEQRRASFTTPERRHIEQILFPTMADAQAAAERLNGGTAFTALAAERGLKEQDIDLGMVTKSAVVDPAVANAAFSLKEGEVSEPIKGQFGAVIVTALKIEPEVVKTLAQVAAQLRNDMALERAKTQVADIHDKLEDDRAGGSSLTEAAQKEKLPVVTYDAVDRAGRDPTGKPVVNLPHGGDVIAAAFTADVGVDNDPIEADGGYVWFDVAAITPAHERGLDDVKAEVEQRWRAEQTASQLKTKAADLLDKLKGGTPFDALADANGVKVETATDLKRGGTNGNITAKMTNAVFHTEKDGYGSAAGDDPTQWIVFRVTDVKTPGLDPNSPEAKHVAETVQRQMTDDIMGEYVDRLEADLGFSVNAAALAQAMGNSSGNSSGNGAPDID
jgi:peptidyl-prolyl cis-trans isomerase D